MSYREHPAHPSLVPWLACIWERAGGPQPVRVLPDGCIDIVYRRESGLQVVGANTTAFLTAADPDSRIVGARMSPGAAPALLGIAAELVRDERLPAEQLLGGSGRQLEAGLAQSDDPVRTLESWLIDRASAAASPDPLVTAAVSRLHLRADDVAGLAEHLGVSSRGLRRRVTAAIGYGPKRLGRVLRLRRALDAARAGDELARVAFDAGYADQAHFSGECRELAGVPPTALLSG